MTNHLGVYCIYQVTVPKKRGPPFKADKDKDTTKALTLKEQAALEERVDKAERASPNYLAQGGPAWHGWRGGHTPPPPHISSPTYLHHHLTTTTTP